MKEKTIRKINRLGHFSQVVALIMKIVVIILLLALAVASIVSIGLPDEALELKVSSNVDVSTDFGFTGKTISPSDQQALLSGKGDIASSLLGDKDTSLQDLLKEQGATIEYKKVTDHFINAVVKGFAPKSFTMTDIRYALLESLIETALFLIVLFVGSSLCKALRYCDSPFEKSVIRRMRGFGFALLFWSLALTCGQAVLDYLAQEGGSVRSNIHLSLLFMALIVLALTRIFKYGAILHREVADELDEFYLAYDDAADDVAEDAVNDDYADAPSDDYSETLPEDTDSVLTEPEAETWPEETGEEVEDASEPAEESDTYVELQQEKGDDL